MSRSMIAVADAANRSLPSPALCWLHENHETASENAIACMLRNRRGVHRRPLCPEGVVECAHVKKRCQLSNVMDSRFPAKDAA